MGVPRGLPLRLRGPGLVRGARAWSVGPVRRRGRAWFRYSACGAEVEEAVLQAAGGTGGTGRCVGRR